MYFTYYFYLSLEMISNNLLCAIEDRTQWHRAAIIVITQATLFLPYPRIESRLTKWQTDTLSTWSARETQACYIQYICCFASAASTLQVGILAIYCNLQLIPPGGRVGSMLSWHAVNPGWIPGQEGYIVTTMITIMAVAWHCIPSGK